MTSPCPTTRDRLLADPESASHDAHLLDCAECTAWWTRAQRIMGALGERIAAPAELDERFLLANGPLPSEQEPPAETPIERELGRLPRLEVPEMLDDLVFASDGLDEAGTQERHTAAMRAIGGLERPSAPHVLERLVAEEIAEPARHRAERFAGDLERLEVPAALEQSPIQTLESVDGNRPRKPSSLLRVVGPVASLAAALLLWATYDGQLNSQEPTQPATREYRFNVVRATSVDQLSPLTRSFVTGMTGGANLSVEPGQGEQPR